MHQLYGDEQDGGNASAIRMIRQGKCVSYQDEEVGEMRRLFNDEETRGKISYQG